MHYIWLMGGLGNVLYQKYVGYYLASRGAIVRYEPCLTQATALTRFAGWTIHDTEYQEQLFHQSELAKLSPWPIVLARLSKGLGVSFASAGFLSGPEVICDRPIPRHVFGYFQEREFIQGTAEKFHDFCTAHRDIWKGNGRQHQHVMHVRLGDSRWGASNLAYYRAVLESIDVEELQILTDSQQEAKQVLDGVKSTCEVKVESRSLMSDFATMCNARTLVVAPSTLSWWAAHLSVRAHQLWMPQSLVERCGVFVPSDIELNVI